MATQEFCLSESSTEPTEAEETSESSQTLHCVICTQIIPFPRDQRQTATCSEKCKDRLDTIRINQRKKRKCAYCLHPSTDEEREEFRQWRAERGDLKRGIDKQSRDRTLPQKAKMVTAMRAIVPAIESSLQLLRGTEATSAAAKKFDDWLPRIKELIDKPAE